MIPLSILDLAPVPEGSDVSQSLANTIDLARHAERLILMRDGSVCVDTRRGEPAFETLLFSLRQD